MAFSETSLSFIFLKQHQQPIYCASQDLGDTFQTSKVFPQAPGKCESCSQAILPREIQMHRISTAFFQFSPNFQAFTCLIQLLLDVGIGDQLRSQNQFATTSFTKPAGWSYTSHGIVLSLDLSQQRLKQFILKSCFTRLAYHQENSFMQFNTINK